MQLNLASKFRHNHRSNQHRHPYSVHMLPPSDKNRAPPSPPNGLQKSPKFPLDEISKDCSIESVDSKEIQPKRVLPSDTWIPRETDKNMSQFQNTKKANTLKSINGSHAVPLLAPPSIPKTPTQSVPRRPVPSHPEFAPQPETPTNALPTIAESCPPIKKDGAYPSILPGLAASRSAPMNLDTLTAAEPSKKAGTNNLPVTAPNTPVNPSSQPASAGIQSSDSSASSSKFTRVERESCYELQKSPFEKFSQFNSKSSGDRTRQIVEELRLKNSQLRYQLTEKAEEARSEREEKELHQRQRTLLTEQVEKLEERNHKLGRDLEQLQSCQKNRDFEIEDRDRRLKNLQESYNETRTMLTAEQSRRYHFEQLYQQLEVSYMTVRESFVDLKMRYKRELLTMRQLVQQIRDECNSRPDDPAIKLHKTQLLSEEQRMKAAIEDWKESQTRYLEIASQLESTVLRQREETQNEVSLKLKEVCEAVASICLNK